MSPLLPVDHRHLTHAQERHQINRQILRQNPMSTAAPCIFTEGFVRGFSPFNWPKYRGVYPRTQKGDPYIKMLSTFLLVGLPQQFAKINTSSLITTHSARNLGFNFDEHLTFSDQISALSRSCYYHIRELRSLRPYLDFKTASTITTFIVHSKLDYCNSRYYNLPQSQIKKLQNIQNSLARAVTGTPKSSHITPGLKSLHWLKINERIKYKLLSVTHNQSINQSRYF